MSRRTTEGGSQTARRVFLAHGHDEYVIEQLKSVLSKLGLSVAGWEELVERLGEPAPFTFDVVRKAIDLSMVFVVLFTPDEAVYKAAHLRDREASKQRGDYYDFQVRPNVLIEAGMALAASKSRTVIVELAEHRRISDLDGMNVVRTNAPEWADKLAGRLKIAFENADMILPLSDGLREELKKVPPIERREDMLTRLSPPGASIEKPAATVVSAPPPGKLVDDPVNRCERLLQVFREYGGPTSARWRFAPDAPDYKVMKEAEAEDERNPLKEGARVYVQQHYESEYNGKVGTVKRYSPEKHFCSVVFEPETGLTRKSFHVMYLSRCK